MEKRDFVILAVAASKKKLLSPVQLQKAMFLIGKGAESEVENGWYEFEPYHYGPFCLDIYEDAESLEKDGLVMRVPSRVGGWTDTLVTYSGVMRAQELRETLPSRTAKYIENVVAWIEPLPFQNLVKSIYEAYPEYRENSVFVP